METIRLEDFENDPIGQFRKVEGGATLLVVRGDRAIAEITPVAAAAKTPRIFGPRAGEFTVPDDFDDPLPEEILADFEGR